MFPTFGVNSGHITRETRVNNTRESRVITRRLLEVAIFVRIADTVSGAAHLVVTVTEREGESRGRRGVMLVVMHRVRGRVCVCVFHVAVVSRSCVVVVVVSCRHVSNPCRHVSCPNRVPVVPCRLRVMLVSHHVSCSKAP